MINLYNIFDRNTEIHTMDVVVKESNIERKGVFAQRDFNKGEIVLDWSKSPILTFSEAERLPPDQEKYVYYCEDKCVLVDPPARFVNHSCDPNIFIRDCFGIAKRAIKKGEEITEDYSLEPNPHLHLICNCKSENCRGIIIGKRL